MKSLPKLSRRAAPAPVSTRPRPPGAVVGRRATPRPVLAGAVAGAVLVVVGLWLAWVPLALIVPGAVLLVWASLFDDEKGGEG